MFSCRTVIEHVKKHSLLKLSSFLVYTTLEKHKNSVFCINGFVSFKSEVKKVGTDFDNDTFMATNNLFHEPKNKL